MRRGFLGVYWRSMRRSLTVLACCASILAGCSSAGGSSGGGEADAAQDASAMTETGSDGASGVDATGDTTGVDAATDSVSRTAP